MKGIKVLSLFDGISIGRLALANAGIAVSEYHSFEIDAAAISISSYSNPDILQRGDVTQIDFEEFRGFDLLLCGSPCQDLSQYTVDRHGLEGKHSSLFWYGAKAVDLGICKHFLFENVAGMRNSDKEIISDALGIQPVRICSSLVSAQSRARYYWTDLPATITECKVKAQEILQSDIAPRDTYTAVLTDPDSLSGQYARLLRKRIQQFASIPDPNGIYLHGSIPYGKRYYNLIEGQRYSLRRLTAVELERLQTMPDNYTKYGIRNGDVCEMGYHARHHAIGNAWTTKIIEAFVSSLE